MSDANQTKKPRGADVETVGSTLTTNNLSKISVGPSNLSAYLQRDETSEKIALGQPTNKSLEKTARELEELVRRLGDMALEE